MSYGLQVFNSDGSLAIGTLSEPPRLIYHEEFDYNFSGTRSVPDFDDTKGFISVSFGHHKTTSGGQTSPSTPIGGTTQVQIDATSLPTVNWNNTTKVLTLAPATFTDTFVGGQSEYSIFMVHYK